MPIGVRSLLRHARRVAVVLLAVGMPLSAAPPAAGAVASPRPVAQVDWAKVDPQIRAKVQRAEGSRAGGDLEVLIVLAARADLAPAQFQTDLAVRLMRAHADAAQAELATTVDMLGGTVRQHFWLTNMLLADLPAGAVEDVARLASVARIVANAEVEVPEHNVSASAPAEPGSQTWGIKKIGADRVWSELGLTGDSVKVAVLDTGVDARHPDLADQLFTQDPDDPTYPGGWAHFDGDGTMVGDTPHDLVGHGTHVSGTVVGGDASGTQIGVAPAADLMAVNVLPGGNGTIAQVIAGMQWTLAPTDRFGNPAGEPADVVNMSLGTESYVREFVEPTRNMVLAGVFPSFSIGNWCSPDTTSSPGNVFEAVAVGATDVNDRVGMFSCGEVVYRSDWSDPPGDWPDSWVVPDISAPGVQILSTLPNGEYGWSDGTSMATPHVSGTVALMRQADPELSVDRALQILADTSSFDDRYGPERPNPRYGWGRVNAWEAASSVALSSGIAGSVRDASTGEPLAGATVSVLDGPTRTTAADGSFDIRLFPGSYSVRIEKYGSVPVAHESVSVVADQLTSLSILLEPAERGTVTGRVTYELSGQQVPGASVVLLAGDWPTTVTDESGRFTLPDIPAGSWRLRAEYPGLASPDPVTVTVEPQRRLPTTTEILISHPEPLERVSLTADGQETDGTSGSPSLSADGRWIAFQSSARALDPSDDNGHLDIFLEDRASGTLERITHGVDGNSPDFGSIRPAISADGRRIAFQSSATNLVPGDTNGVSDIFLYDRDTRQTTLVSAGLDGEPASGASQYPSISADGTHIAFESRANNLTPGDTNGRQDVFIYEVATGTLELGSRSADGVPGNRDSYHPAISREGRLLVYHTLSDNLLAGQDTNGRMDIMVLNRETGVVQRASVTSQWAQADGHSLRPDISDDGRYVVFESAATNLEDGHLNPHTNIFVRDRVEFRTWCLTCQAQGEAGNGQSNFAKVSGDGSRVVFASAASNLVTGDSNGVTDIFRTTIDGGQPELVSAGEWGPGNSGSDSAAVSGDGRIVAFQSSGFNLTPDTNGYIDAYLRDMDPTAARAQFVVSELSTQIEIGTASRVRVRFVATNIGGVQGGYTAGVYVDGVLAGTGSLDLRPGESEQVSMWVPVDGPPGRHTVTVGHLRAPTLSSVAETRGSLSWSD